MTTRTMVAGAVGAMVLAMATTASAANNRACRSSKPPVIVVHGQAGDFNQMTDVTRTLEADGFCVFGQNYGIERPGGRPGRAHVDASASEVGAFIDGVMRDTGATKVNVIGHSAGTGVLDNWIQLKGGAAKVNRLVSFAGMHHPYAHIGLPTILDANIFLPNAVRAVQSLMPPFTSNLQIRDLALAAFGVLGPNGPISPDDQDLAMCGFTADLFSPQYWTKLQGGLSEVAGQFVAVGTSVRSLETNDAAPNVCYTNIVGLADPLVGANAGFQHENTNVENFVLKSTADHSTILNDRTALNKMLAGLNARCTPANPNAGAKNVASDGKFHFGGDDFAEVDAKRRYSITQEDVEEELEARGERRPRLEYDLESSGCTASPRSGGSNAGVFAAVALGLTALTRRGAQRRGTRSRRP